MAIVRSVRRIVIINKLLLEDSGEVVTKSVKETLALFRIELRADKMGDYTCLQIKNKVQIDELADDLQITTQAVFTRADGSVDIVNRQKTVHIRSDERPKATERRVFRQNLYDILREKTGLPPAPWGIMHGVRPTKIVHKYIDQGLARAAIIDRLANDYYVSAEKAMLLTDIAFKQRSFLSLSSPDTISVYIGIPFCLSRCLYCSFPAYVLPKQDKLDEFMTALKADMEAAHQSIVRHGLKVQSIYIGGGTPTSLPDREFSELLELAVRFFKQPCTQEFTVEAGRPDSVNDFKIQLMLHNGVNRVSVNPQTMQQKTLNYIGRKHTVEAIIELFGKFRSEGMESINMDLILGLPGETLADVEDTLQKVTALEPDDLTIHALALKRGSRLKTDLAAYPLPDDQSVQAMFALALQYMQKNGLEPYYLYRQGYMSGNMENIGCSRKGKEGLYNIQIMEERQTIIGIGPAATTKVVHTDGRPLETSFNAKDLTTYLNSIHKYILRRADLLNGAFAVREE